MAENHRSSTLLNRYRTIASQLGMAENHRSSTLADQEAAIEAELGMAENHRSSTLIQVGTSSDGALGMAENHRSSTLHPCTEVPIPFAGDGRESPLKYTGWRSLPFAPLAGDGRESPLKYTSRPCESIAQSALGMAENHRSSTLGFQR